MSPVNWHPLACTFEALKMAGYPDGQTKMTRPTTSLHSLIRSPTTTMTLVTQQHTLQGLHYALGPETPPGTSSERVWPTSSTLYVRPQPQ